MITGNADIRDAMRAVREGLFDYLTKPFENLEKIEAVIGKAPELDRAYREIDRLREALEGREGPLLIGRSRAMEIQLAQVRQVAPLDTTVLMEPESGASNSIDPHTPSLAGEDAEYLSASGIEGLAACHASLPRATEARSQPKTSKSKNFPVNRGLSGNFSLLRPG